MMTIAPITPIRSPQRAPRFSGPPATGFPEKQPSLLAKLEAINGTNTPENEINTKLLETPYFHVGDVPISGRALLSLISELADNQAQAHESGRKWYDRLRETLVPSSKPNTDEVNIDKLYKLLYKGGTETDVNTLVNQLEDRGFLYEESQWEPRTGKDNMHVRYIALTDLGKLAVSWPSLLSIVKKG